MRRKALTGAKTFAQDLTNQKGDDVWPITSTTFILVHKAQKKPEQGAEVLKVLRLGLQKWR
ncbi:phosphate ABC transporter periplasmic substrate-binding protein PstS [Salmonella enterica subsp. enterica]|uniref:Phosphate ABC transporter periplasmic substrate-binding protein PstS n=1 Tax=Salmonella enterica I TaxID=59201 RepID=A0A379UYM2_SALET|nr:phosphate ABC transporter periplasmic substrate-binding protein PstS [Salmonella enterica subsp. enterica]